MAQLLYIVGRHYALQQLKLLPEAQAYSRLRPLAAQLDYIYTEQANHQQMVKAMSLPCLSLPCISLPHIG